MELFIVKNGFQLNASQTEKYLTFLTLADGSLSEDQLAHWLRERIAPISS